MMLPRQWSSAWFSARGLVFTCPSGTTTIRIQGGRSACGQGVAGHADPLPRPPGSRPAGRAGSPAAPGGATRRGGDVGLAVKRHHDRHRRAVARWRAAAAVRAAAGAARRRRPRASAPIDRPSARPARRPAAPDRCRPGPPGPATASSSQTGHRQRRAAARRRQLRQLSAAGTRFSAARRQPCAAPGVDRRLRSRAAGARPAATGPKRVLQHRAEVAELLGPGRWRPRWRRPPVARAAARGAGSPPRRRVDQPGVGQGRCADRPGATPQMPRWRLQAGRFRRPGRARSSERPAGEPGRGEPRCDSGCTHARRPRPDASRSRPRPTGLRRPRRGRGARLPRQGVNWT